MTEAKHKPSDIAKELHLSPQWIRELCRRVTKQTGKHHRLTDAQKAEVIREQKEFGRKRPE